MQRPSDSTMSVPSASDATTVRSGCSGPPPGAHTDCTGHVISVARSGSGLHGCGLRGGGGGGGGRCWAEPPPAVVGGGVVVAWQARYVTPHPPFASSTHSNAPRVRSGQVHCASLGSPQPAQAFAG